METTSTSTSTRNTTSEPPNSYTTVTVTLTLTLRNTVPTLPHRSYRVHRICRQRTGPTRETSTRDGRAPGSGRGSRRTARRYERVSSSQVRFAAAFRVTSSLLYFYFYICGLVFAARCALPAVRSRAGSPPSPMVDVDDASPSGSESQASHTACVGPCHRTPAPPGRAAALVVHCSSASVKRAPKRSRARSWLQVPNQEGTLFGRRPKPRAPRLVPPLPSTLQLRTPPPLCFPRPQIASEDRSSLGLPRRRSAQRPLDLSKVALEQSVRLRVC